MTALLQVVSSLLIKDISWIWLKISPLVYFVVHFLSGQGKFKKFAIIFRKMFGTPDPFREPFYV